MPSNLLELEIRTVNGDHLLGSATVQEGSYEHARVCQVLRAVCLKGYLDKVSNKEMPQALDDVRTTFCPGCHLRPKVCRGIELVPPTP